jgi:hypothetical protein
MIRDDIIHMAREAGFGSALTYHKGELRLERFAELLEAKIRADEREACAKVCEDASKPREGEMHSDAQWAGLVLATTIRARGNE